MTPRKAVDNELTKEMIMDTARELFAEQGFQHVSMRKIAQSLGYSHGALYYHFKNKAEISLQSCIIGLFLAESRDCESDE